MIGEAERRRVIFGCGNFGGLGSSPYLRDKGDSRERALGLLDHARTLGLTRFDTANTYGGGASETILGEWLRGKSPAYRHTIEVATKVGNPHGCPSGDRPLSRRQIEQHLDRSLTRLGVDRIDLYYIHEFDLSTPIEETLEAFDSALAAGKIAAFGVSNASVNDLQSVLSLTSGPIRKAFTHVQNQFNALVRDDLADVIPLAAAEGVAYAAFSPLAGGLLTGKYRLDRPAEPGTRAGDAPAFYDGLLTEQTFELIETLRDEAKTRGWSIAARALRFILDTPGVDALIIAPRSIAQFEAYGIRA